jgi:hypothetical protein
VRLLTRSRLPVTYLDCDMEFVWTLMYLDKASRQRSSAVQIKPPQPRHSFLSAISTNPATIRIDKIALVESSWNGLGQSLMSSRANDFSGARDRLGKRSSNSARNQQMMSRAEIPSPQSPFAIHQILSRRMSGLIDRGPSNKLPSRLPRWHAPRSGASRRGALIVSEGGGYCGQSRQTFTAKFGV